MKVLVVCLLVTAALADAAPSEVLPGDVPALKPHADASASSSSSTSSVSTSAVEKTSADTAASHGDKEEASPAVAPSVAYSVTPLDVEKVKTEQTDKGDVSVEPVIESAEPSAPSGQDISVHSPVKKVPVFVPVEYAGAYHPDNFFNPYPVTSSLGGYVAAPTATYPYRSVAHPWYQLVSPEVPILTLYPGNSDESLRLSGMACADPTLRYVHGAAPVMYTGPAAASPYAANQFAAASLANMGVAGNPNPYGAHAPYYKFSYIPDTPSYVTPSNDFFRSTLIPPTSKVSPTSSISPLSRLSPISPIYSYPGSSNFNPFASQISPLDTITFYGRSELN